MIDFITDNGVVINKQDIGEADRKITVFTENYGRVSFLLKGIRKSKKREINAVDIFSLSKFIFFKKGDYYNISNVTGIETFDSLKYNIDTIGCGLYLMNVLNEILVENNRKKRLYSVTIKSLEYLGKNNEINKNYILIAFYLYFIIKDEGMAIKYEDGEYFSIADSKFINKKIDGVEKISKIEKEILKKILEEKSNDLLKSEYELSQIKNIIFILEKYINFHFGVKIKLKDCIMGE